MGRFRGSARPSGPGLSGSWPKVVGRWRLPTSAASAGPPSVVAMPDQPADASQIVPDTKDWTWTLQRPCPDCGFDAGSVAAADIAPTTLA